MTRSFFASLFFCLRHIQSVFTNCILCNIDYWLCTVLMNRTFDLWLCEVYESNRSPSGNVWWGSRAAFWMVLYLEKHLEWNNRAAVHYSEHKQHAKSRAHHPPINDGICKTQTKVSGSICLHPAVIDANVNTFICANVQVKINLNVKGDTRYTFCTALQYV